MLAVLFLLSYLLNVVSFESFHQFVHQHQDAELHTAEAEADSCHRAIYHGDFSHDCHHKTHLTKQLTHCDLCKVTVSRFHFASASVETNTKPSHSVFNEAACVKVVGHDFSLLCAPRGPPAFS